MSELGFSGLKDWQDLCSALAVAAVGWAACCPPCKYRIFDVGAATGVPSVSGALRLPEIRAVGSKLPTLQVRIFDVGARHRRAPTAIMQIL